MSRGQAETDQLRGRLESQLDRLLEQLSDLEKDREDLGEEEYAEMRQDTLEQVGEFEASLKRLCSGDLGLVDSLNAMQLAMQATVSQKCAFGFVVVKTVRTGCLLRSPLLLLSVLSKFVNSLLRLVGCWQTMSKLFLREWLLL